MRLEQDNMSHTSDDATVLPGSESFWEPGNYKRTTKRIEDGEKLCKDLIALVQERANIEKEYAKMLKNWSNKWNKHIENGPEYGTTEAAWKGVCGEADKRHDLHMRLKDNLLNEVVNSIKNWQKDNYHRTMMQLKEKKELEEQFRKAQKPWAKLLDKVNKAKTDHHTACKNERTAINQEKNANSDSSLSQDQVRKLQDKVSKCATSVKKTKEDYELALLDINNYNSRYMEDMTEVFERCQRKEAQRLQTFKETLFSIHKCLDISQDPQLPSIYEEFYHTVNNADHEKDLRWWSNTHGVNMAMAWPQFEEYTEEFREIAAKHKKMTNIPDGNITLINQRSVCDDLPHIRCYEQKILAKLKRKSGEYTLAAAREYNAVKSGGTKKAANGAPKPNSTNNHDQPPTNRASMLVENPAELQIPEVENAQPERKKSSTSTYYSSTTRDNSSAPKNPFDDTATADAAADKNPFEDDLSSSIDDEDEKSSYLPDIYVSDRNFIPALDLLSVHSESNQSNIPDNGVKDQNPFDEDSEEWDDAVGVPLVDNGEPGVPVRALYDYEAAEDDELSFKTGDELEKLEDEDEQGWCKGRKDGKVGLYPANYVEPID